MTHPLIRDIVLYEMAKHNLSSSRSIALSSGIDSEVIMDVMKELRIEHEDWFEPPKNSRGENDCLQMKEARRGQIISFLEAGGFTPEHFQDLKSIAEQEAVKKNEQQSQHNA